ncbi:hypothetical protein BH18ACT1_BH18ACT1_07910 [soil metagenome]
MLVAALAWPMPRSVGEVTAAMRVEPSGRGAVDVEVDVTPADAGDGARWFQASSWQGGELALAEMEEVAPGPWASSEPVPIGGSHKSLLRLHRGGEMMAVPVFLPDDPEIGEPEIPAVDRTMAFESEGKYLLRETEDGDAWFAYAIYVLLSVVALAWMAGFALVASRSRATGGGPALVGATA